MNYNLLKSSLNFNASISWLSKDVKDDFYPDPIGWKDINKYQQSYLDRIQHRIFQFDNVAKIMEYVPQKSGLLREAIWLHPAHRILYLAILHRFASRLDAKMLSSVYSYRCDNQKDTTKHPFSKTIDRWKDFHNDFRRAALDSSTGAILVTDLASYYDHINIEELGDRIESVLGSNVNNADKEVITFLVQLLKFCGYKGYGIPQNYDPSSFFGSLYLHNIDHEMVNNRRYKYFRWVDDIRIVASNRKQALRALHDLQEQLAHHRLFLATDKTNIIDKNDPNFSQLLSVEDDILISEAEDKIRRADKNELEEIASKLFDRLRFHASPEGDDRKFRAFANRLLDISDFVEVEQEIASHIHEFVRPQFALHPERSDYWAKMLSVKPNNIATEILKEHLIDNPSVFNWQRYYLWKLATNLPNELIPDGLIDKARETSQRNISENESAQSIVFMGNHCTNTDCENIFESCFSPQRSYVVQRAVLIAIQKLPNRNKYYSHALEQNPDLTQLANYLMSLATPDYGYKERSPRHCAEPAIDIQYLVTRGIGLVDGQIRRFRLVKGDYDY